MSKQCCICRDGILSGYTDLTWKIWDHNYGLVICSTCGCAFTDPLPSTQVLEQLYATSFNYRWYQDHIWAKFKDCRQRIIEYAPFLGRRVLDYGGGIGYFSQAAREAGYESRTYDPYAGKDQLEEQKWDTVVCLHMLEHVNNPDEAIVRLKDLLAEGGRLILVVPNFSSEGYRQLGMSWVWAQPPLLHIFHFTSSGLEKLLQRHGFKIICVSYHERWDANLQSDLIQVERFKKLDADWHRQPFNHLPVYRKFIALRNSFLRFKAFDKADANSFSSNTKLSELQIVCSL